MAFRHEPRAGGSTEGIRKESTAKRQERSVARSILPVTPRPAAQRVDSACKMQQMEPISPADKMAQHRFRLRVRFTLRTLLIAVTILSSVLGWWVHRTRVQQTAIRRLVQAGGTVEYSYYYEPIHNDSWVQGFEAHTVVPKWLRQMMGEDYFTSVISVDLMNCSDEAADVNELMRVVGDLKHLRFFRVPDGLTDAGMKHLAHLKLLERLELRYPRISDAGMHHLAALNNLVQLELSDTPVSDVGLANAHIADKRRLRILSMSHTAISDDGLFMLVNIPKLWLINVNFTNVTDGGKRKFKEARPDPRGLYF